MIKMKRYSGAQLNELRLPLGGIGAGCLSINGAGRLVDWEVSGYANKNSSNGFTHFAIKAVDAQGHVWARALQGDEPGNRMGNPQGGNFGCYGFGQPRETLGGLPHFPDIEFEAAWPAARLGFEYEGFPGRAELYAFSPFIPLDTENTSLPAAFFEWEVSNTTDKALDYTFCYSMTNPFNPQGAENRHEVIDNIHAIVLENNDYDRDSRKCGALMASVQGDGQVCWQEYWYRGTWFDGLQVFWNDFTVQGPMKNRHYDDAGAIGDTASLAITNRVEAGSRWKVRFLLNWYYPWMENDWNPMAHDEPTECCCGIGCPDCDKEPGGRIENRWRKWYAVRFPDVTAVMQHCTAHYAALKTGTNRFLESFTNSTLPEPALDAALSTLASLVTPLCLRLTDGSFYGFEGLHTGSGCCEGSCDHVWNYAYALCYLFPDLERSMRDLDLMYNLDEHGGLRFRLQLPLGRKRWEFIPCADGQFGAVIKLWRDYLLCGDLTWLQGHWPRVKAMLSYAWSPENSYRWDPDKAGILTGRQHHTLDMELFGPNSWLTGMYLAALKAAMNIADLLGDTEAKQEFTDVFERGRKWVNEYLFNGEYFYHLVDLADRSILNPYVETAMFGNSVHDVYWDEEHSQIKYQIGEGSSIDQLLGQWHANLSGIGEIFNHDKVMSALNSICRYNYMQSMRDFFNPCRLYCVNDEGGTLICAYPEGARTPVIPAPYSQETMHGFEYQVACHMVQEGMVEQGMNLVKAVRDRYDGRYRNPFNEIECGSNYARSMAAFALVPSFAGMTADLGRGYMHFNPVVEGDFRCFFSVASGWGKFAIESGKAIISVLHGRLHLKELDLPFLHGSVMVVLGGQEISSVRTVDGVKFLDPVDIPEGNELRLLPGNSITV